MFNFTPLLGAQSDSPASQSLIELDGGVKVLIDVGWDEGFDVEKLQALEKHVSTISFILLTHPTIDHLGAFAHCCKHFPQFTRIPVYATTPVVSLGRTLLQDLYASTPVAASVIPASSLAEITYSSAFSKNGPSPNILLQPPTAEEIASYFSLINPLKYSQPHQPIPSPDSPPLNGLVITAYNAGHTLGGTIWHIQYGLESIVYAVDWNQAKENVVSGAAWLGSGGGGAEIIEQLRRPTALVCSSKGVERTHLSGGRRKRDDALLDLVRDTVRSGGTVLIPTDSSARILELAYILEHHWRAEVGGANGEVYRNAKIHLASRSAGSTLRYTRSMVEWMDEGIVRDMEAASEGSSRAQKDGTASADQTPFDFRHVKLMERKTQIDRVLTAGKAGVILASDRSLEWGFSRNAIKSLCNDRCNLVILTEKVTQPESGRKGLGRYLWELWEKRAASSRGGATLFDVEGMELAMRETETARLEGDETIYYQQFLARQRQMHSTQQGDDTMTEDTAAEIADDRSSTTSESSEGSDVEHQGRSLNITATMTQSKRKIGLTDAELGVNILLRKKNVYDYDVRGKRGREKVFPFAGKRSRTDEFGDVIRPDEYLRAEERDEMDGQDVNDDSKNETAVGQKRKWGDVAPRGGQGRRSSKGMNKRSKTGMGDDAQVDGREAFADGDAASDESEESDYEPEETVPEGPLKAIFKEETIRLNLRVAYVDFAGLFEKRDLQMLIPLIRPRKLILVAGEAKETLSLAEDCKALMESGEDDTINIFAPTIGESVDASVDTNAWSLKLSQDLLKRLAWQNVKGLSVVAVTGRLDTIRAAMAGGDEADESRRKKLKMIKGDEETDIKTSNLPTATESEPEPVLDVLPTYAPASNQLVTQPIHVGDLRLADLRRLMQASGHRADFRGEGTLVIDDAVVVRKSASGRIEVEGGGYMMPGARAQHYEGTFFAVKRKIYEGLAVVAGG